MLSRTSTLRQLMCCVALIAALVTAAFAIVCMTQRRTAAIYQHNGRRRASDARRDDNAKSTNLKSVSTAKLAAEQRLLPDATAAAFRPRMSSGEKAAALRCLGELDKALGDASVTYFLYGGTLLGARRHRGIVPWDDDVDVLANYKQLSELEQALLSVDGYELHFWHKNRYKFYPSDGAPIRGKPWRWPYVDVCFFSENATHVFDNYPGLSTAFSYAKADVFPLAYRPFDGLSLPTPANEERVLARNYDENTCESNWFSHRHEAEVRKSDVTSVPCSELYATHPFIFRNATTPPMHEMLKVGDKIVAEFVIF